MIIAVLDDLDVPIAPIIAVQDNRDVLAGLIIVVQIAIPTVNKDGEMASKWCEISFRMIATLH